MRIVVVGATRNFFKVGHATFRVLRETRPDVQLRLVIPDIVDASRAIVGLDVDLAAWDPAAPETLRKALVDCDSMLMVPPIDGRVLVARAYLDAAVDAGIGYILCLGVQHRDGTSAMSDDVGRVDDLLADSGITHDTLRLPMFLENLLYQVPSIVERGQFAFPISADAPFCFTTCADLAEVFAPILADPAGHRPAETFWTGTTTLTCGAWADALSSATGRRIRFCAQPRDEFAAGLIRKGMSERAASSVLELWDLIEVGMEPQPTEALSALLGRPTTTATAWCQDHACCFGSAACLHPKPPRDHMF
jgi:uncharacterized protein YbjT (DUF2867 family)